MMNIFRLTGDMSHLFSILVLLLKLRASKSAAVCFILTGLFLGVRKWNMERQSVKRLFLGALCSISISLKTQELFLVVFLARYTDLFLLRFISFYNSIMKILYIGLTAIIVYTIRETIPIKVTYDKAQDSFFHWKFAVLPCAVLGFIVNTWDLGFYGFYNITNLLWIVSECLEPMAIVPQLIVLQRYREVENLTGHYVFLLGLYRCMYVLNWVYRAYHEPHYVHRPLLYAGAFIQTLLYADFFYYYALSKYYGRRLSLPS